MSFAKLGGALAVIALLISCGGWTPPQPPPNPCAACTPEQTCVDGVCVDPIPPKVPPTAEQCHLMTPPAMANCYDNPQNGESFPEWDPNWGYVCALVGGGTTRVGTPAECEVPELPQPQCPSFVNRGGGVSLLSGSCDCYEGTVWHGCVPPPPSECVFPQGVPNSDFTMGPVKTEFAATVNTAMKVITGCNIGSDCPTGMTPDDWMHAVIEKIKLTGLCAGRHVDTTPGGTDEIAVAAKCTNPWEGYKIYNYGGGKVIWSPNANRPSWTITPGHCSGGPVEPPPVGDCPLPHPDLTRMKFKSEEKGNHLDTTWTTVNQEPFCRSIGMSPMGDGTPRAGCPVRPEGNEERGPCEAELCAQKWECNGQPVGGWKGNPAQTNCVGHYKTWCSAAGSTAVLEGDR